MPIFRDQRARLIAAGLILLSSILAAPALAQPQTPLAGSALPQFVDPLPIPTILTAGAGEIPLRACEFKARVLPTGTFVPGVRPQTWVWGYVPGACPSTVQTTYIGPVIVATRGAPSTLRFINDLGTAATTNVLAYKRSTDQTLHWADPSGAEANACAEEAMMSPPGTPPSADCAQHFEGPVPAVVHLHGGEVPPQIDGGPNAWVTSDGSAQGSSYYTFPGVVAAGNEAVYRYPNSQEAAPIWFHDHTMGATRLNVYAGLAGAYLITDPARERTDLPPLVPLVIQDRMFDTNGQLYFPAGAPSSPTPDHPYWVPEFLGDTVVVNGAVWPFLDVERKRYRFIFLNGSNARTYELFLTNPARKVDGPAIWQIGTDGGYLDTPVKIDPASRRAPMQRLVLMPGERADTIVDFAGLAPGTVLVLKNIAKAPYPGGSVPAATTTGRVLQFRVLAGAAGPDSSYDPAAGASLRTPMVRLANPGAGTLADGVTPQSRRQLTLNEVMGEETVVDGVAYEGGPREVLVNNTRYDGRRSDGSPRGDFTPLTVGGHTMYSSEQPNEGDTELWEIVNLTEDAHPIHFHLVQAQLVSRQAFSVSKYEDAYARAFGGEVQDGAGPPNDYNLANLDGALGGNPAVSSSLKGKATPPALNEAGWKDTFQVFPGEVTRIAIRYAPTDKAIDDPGLFYSFAPEGGPGYVWHCHIIDHEDNEMMRPFLVRTHPEATRTYLSGVDY